MMKPRPVFADFPHAPIGSIVGDYTHPYWTNAIFAGVWIAWRAQGMIGPEPKPSEFPATTPSTQTSEIKTKSMPPSSNQQTGSGSVSVPGEALLINHGFTVVNTTNGKLEMHQGPTVIAGLSSANLADMLTAQKALELEFAKKSELTTDESSPDDKA
jgi:hypothetical protein